MENRPWLEKLQCNWNMTDQPLCPLCVSKTEAEPVPSGSTLDFLCSSKCKSFQFRDHLKSK